MLWSYFAVVLVVLVVIPGLLIPGIGGFLVRPDKRSIVDKERSGLEILKDITQRFDQLNGMKLKRDIKEKINDFHHRRNQMDKWLKKTRARIANK